jgi:hypothetical protein
MSLQQLLNEHVLDSKNTYKIFKLAQEYDRLGQGAMAVSLYLKTADLEEEDKLLQYKSLLGIAKCYDRQKNRKHTVIGVLLQAAALIPERPEAHYFICKHYEENNEWRQCLLHAQFGLKADQHDDIDVDYPGKQSLYFYQAISTWHISGTQPGKDLLFNLKYKNHLNEEYKLKVSRILDNIQYPFSIPYKKEDLPRYKFSFDGIENIEKNYSRHFQDMFVLTVLNGKRSGSYIEIAPIDPFTYNSTALLETKFDWKGISIENSEAFAYNFKNKRSNPVICANPLDIDFKELFSKHCLDNTIDLLQIGRNDSCIEVLKKIPFNEYKFAVVQFQHDAHRLDPEIKETSRRILQSAGYILLVNDVAFNEYASYDDWWVHPDLVDINPVMKTSKNINFVWNYFMKELE